MASKVEISVNGKIYGGWKTARVSRSIEAIAGSFALDVSERWFPDGPPWPIREGDECAVLVDGKTLITGYVDIRRITYSASGHEFAITGRDKTGDLVDSSAVLDKWEFINTTADKIISAVLVPFGIPLTIAGGVTIPPARVKVAINPGQSAFDVIDEVCRESQLLPVSDGLGGLILTQAGTSRAGTELIEGKNILSCSASYSNMARFNRYIVAGSHPTIEGYFDDSELAAAITATARDESVRVSRVLLQRPPKIVTLESAQKRADWEATTRAARAGDISVTVQGWTQGDGSLWPLNTLVRLRAPLIGIDNDMLITSVSFSMDDKAGTLTELKLRQPLAFTPEPIPPDNVDVWDIAE